MYKIRNLSITYYETNEYCYRGEREDTWLLTVILFFITFINCNIFFDFMVVKTLFWESIVVFFKPLHWHVTKEIENFLYPQKKRSSLVVYFWLKMFSFLHYSCLRQASQSSEKLFMKSSSLFKLNLSIAIIDYSVKIQSVKLILLL